MFRSSTAAVLFFYERICYQHGLLWVVGYEQVCFERTPKDIDELLWTITAVFEKLILSRTSGWLCWKVGFETPPWCGKRRLATSNKLLKETTTRIDRWMQETHRAYWSTQRIVQRSSSNLYLQHNYSVSSLKQKLFKKDTNVSHRKLSIRAKPVAKRIHCFSNRPTRWGRKKQVRQRYDT